jgi:hypothetical protein
MPPDAHRSSNGSGVGGSRVDVVSAGALRPLEPGPVPKSLDEKWLRGCVDRARQGHVDDSRRIPDLYSHRIVRMYE